MARGHLVGLAPDIKATWNAGASSWATGVVHAIPELEGRVAGVDCRTKRSGQDRRRGSGIPHGPGLDEEEAVSTIVRGFLNVKIEGLPAALEDEMEHAIQETAGGFNPNCDHTGIYLPGGPCGRPGTGRTRGAPADPELFFILCATVYRPGCPGKAGGR